MSLMIAAEPNRVRTNWWGWLVIAAAVGLTLVGAVHVAAAEESLSIGDFAGHFRGEAQVQAGDRFFVQQMRDADVTLRPEADGFRLSWTTVIHPAEGRERQRHTDLRFIVGPTQRQFRTAEAVEPFAEKPAAWGYIDGSTLTVHVLNILADGKYELQTYERSLSGNVMKLNFYRVSSGMPELVVTGRLTRQPDGK